MLKCPWILPDLASLSCGPHFLLHVSAEKASSMSVSIQLLTLKNPDEATMNSNLMLVAGHLFPLHSKTCSQVTKATIQGGNCLRAATGPQKVGDLWSYSSRWQRCGLLLEATVRLDGILLPSDTEEVSSSIYSLNKSTTNVLWDGFSTVQTHHQSAHKTI